MPHLVRELAALVTVRIQVSVLLPPKDLAAFVYGHRFIHRHGYLGGNFIQVNHTPSATFRASEHDCLTPRKAAWYSQPVSATSGRMRS